MNRTVSHRAARRLFPILVSSGLSACGNDVLEQVGVSDARRPLEVVGTALELLGGKGARTEQGRHSAGREAFEEALAGTNGRSCASCHVLDEGTTLLPESVRARLEENAADPLFNRLDADDPNADVLTFEHLKKGLVRVVLRLPDNLDVIDLDGRVITAADRTIAVWRGVPSIVNTALTGPYQLDGREATLESQARAAIVNHSQGAEPSPEQLTAIADFEREQFSSPRAQIVSRLLELGLPLEEIPVPEELMSLSASEKRGRDVYDAACQACHGSASTDRIVDREVHDLFFSEVGADGNLRFEMVEGRPVTVPLARPDDEFLNVGFGFASYLGQVGIAPAFNDDVELPRYRFRFYTDASRSHIVTDLPPVPVTLSGDPLDPRPALDEQGAPIMGPSRSPQLFSTDPGRAAISGDPADFEAFDVNPLRGIARTAPYFHDNSHETLEDVIDSYSRFVLSFLTPLNLPRIHPPESPDGPPEALSVQQKHDLAAFLRRL